MSGIVRFFASSLPLWEAADGAVATSDGGAVGGASGVQTAQEHPQQVENEGDGPSSRAGSGPASTSGAADTAEATGVNANNPSSTGANAENAGAAANDNGAAAGQSAPSKPGPTMSVEQYGQSLIPTADDENSGTAGAGSSGTADDAADAGPVTGDNVTMEVEQPAAAPAANAAAPSLTYKEWSALRRRAFEKYMNRRMVSPSSSSSSSSQSSSSSASGGTNSRKKKSKGAKGDGSPSQDTAESSLLLSASSGSPDSSAGLLSSIDGSPMKQESLDSPDGGKKAMGEEVDDDDDESRHSIDGSPLPEYAAAEADGDEDDEAMDESMFDDADIPETDIFQVFEDDADYHHGRDRPLETQPETQEQMLPETQEDPPLPVQQSQSQSPEYMSQSQPQSQSQSQMMMDTQPLMESQPETQQEEEGAMMLGQDSQQDEDDDDDDDVDDLPDTQDATQKSPDVIPMDVEVDANVVPESSTKKRKKSDKKKGGKKKKEEDANRRRRKDRRKILHESQTRGTANTVEQINLRVHTVNLGLCRVVTAWPLRKTKRLHWQADTNSTPTCTASANDKEGNGTTTPAKGMGGLRILTTPYSDFEDDGPLGNIYRSVFTLEVEEVVDEEREEALREQRRLFQRPFELTDDVDDEEAGDKTKDSADKAAALTAKTRRRIRVFLYGKYANKVSRHLSEWKYRLTSNSKTCALAGEGREEVLLSLNNVPARCVFPYYGQTSSEAPILDNELGRCSRYCLCIGSNSHMMVTSEDAGEGEKERFDTVNSVGSAADLEMRIVMVRKAAMAAVVGSPSQIEMQVQHSASSSTFKSTAESILSLSAIERKESEGPGPNASDLAALYSEIIAKKEKRIQQLIDEARFEGNKKDQGESIDEVQRKQETGGKESGDQAEAPSANPEEGIAGEEGEQARKRRRTSVRYHTLVSQHFYLFSSLYLNSCHRTLTYSPF